MVLINWWNSKT